MLPAQTTTTDGPILPHSVLSTVLDLLGRPGLKSAVKVQILQSISIMLENVRQEESMWSVARGAVGIVPPLLC